MNQFLVFRRKYTRYKVNLGIRYSFRQNREIKARVLDLSIRGAQLRINHVLDLNDIIYIYFLQEEMPIQIITSKVVYVNGNVIGVKFDLDDSSIIFLDKYIREKIKNKKWRKI